MAKAKKKRNKRYDRAKLEKMLDAHIQKTQNKSFKEKCMNRVKSAVALSASAFAAVKAFEFREEAKAVSEFFKVCVAKIRRQAEKNPVAVEGITRVLKCLVGAMIVSYGSLFMVVSSTISTFLLGFFVTWTGYSLMFSALFPNEGYFA